LVGTYRAVLETLQGEARVNPRSITSRPDCYSSRSNYRQHYRRFRKRGDVYKEQVEARQR